MYRLAAIVLLSIVGLGAASMANPARADGIGPAGLAAAGWTCFQPPQDFNPYIHCAPPGQFESIVSGTARAAMFIAFDTTDLDAERASIRGTERLIRADLYHGQPCPTDPPTYEYSSLEPRFGWNYFICHSFDSPW